MSLTPEQKDMIGLELTEQERAEVLAIRDERRRNKVINYMKIAAEDVLEAMLSGSEIKMAIATHAMKYCIEQYENVFGDTATIVRDHFSGRQE